MIKILNYRNNCEISHPLVVILGIIRTKDKNNSKNQFINCKYLEEDHKCLLIKNDNQLKFKFIFLLRKGSNIFKFTYKQIALKLTIKFTKLNVKRFVKPIYLVCSTDKNNKQGTVFEDGEFQSSKCDNQNKIENAKKRIGLALLMVQTFISSTLPNRTTFDLELRDEDNYPIVDLFHSECCLDDYKRMDQEEMWRSIAIEILKSNISNCTKYLVFVSFSRYKYDEKLVKNLNQISYDELINMTQCFIALGGGNLAALSTCSLFCWPEKPAEIETRFNDSTLIDSRFEINDCGLNLSTYGSLYFTSLGSLIHELAHTFDLGHESYGLMDRDFFPVKLYFINTHFELDLRSCWSRSAFLILMNHKFLNKNLKYLKNDDEELTDGMDVLNLNDVESTSLIKCNNFDFDKERAILNSKNGIILVEYRDEKSYTLDYLEYNLPKKSISLANNSYFKSYKNGTNALVILVVDCFGNIFKFN